MKGIMKRLLCFVLILAMLATYAVPAHATETAEVSFKQVDNSVVSATIPGREPVELPEEEKHYADTDVVRVSIVLEKAGTIEVGYSPINIAGNSSAMAYRDSLENEQNSVVSKIESAIQNDLDVVWNLTLAANIISANVEFGQIEKIEEVEGVKSVIIETRYEPDVVSSGSADPNMATSGVQIGSAAAWAAGYTGAGSKIAIIDTGADVEHEAFDAAAFEYSIDQLDTEVDLFDASDISTVISELNAYKDSDVSAEDLYVNSKIPYGFNYIDGDLDIEHINDAQGEHGSHVAGIATANAYVNNGDGTFSYALDTTYVQGVAPDAQLMVMKVFGKGGGAYDSDYMAAIEDAVILGADSVNLSLGSGNPGMSTVDSDYRDIMESLVQSGVVVAMSAGNSGYWSESAESGLPYNYLDDVSMQTDGSPGSYTNAFTVASVDNDGFTATYFDVNGNIVSYNDKPEYGNAPMATLAGTQQFVFVNTIGELADFEAVGAENLEGKIVMCYRGTTSFFEKANAAASMGAAGVVIVNNQAGIINLDLTGYEYTVPVVSILQADGEVFKTVGTENTTASGIDYWTGSLDVSEGLGVGQYNSEYYTMSSFSSWGVPGSLELKPEITAPGGSIYSVAGAINTGDFSDHASYEIMSGTSMASPQVAGMAAVMAQYVRESGLVEKTGLDERTLTQSLLMSTAVPLRDGNSEGNYYPVIQQGAGLANVGAATTADSYIIMGSDATDSWADGKVKAELGDDPSKEGVYSFSFTVNNLTDEAKELVLSADVFTQDAFDNSGILLMDTRTTDLTPYVSWYVNGMPYDGSQNVDGMDFNGDGAVNTADGQILLDYATGLDVTLSNEDKADMNADGEINSYDAYLFFDLLNKGGVALPANGSADVTVTITLSDADKDWLANYENGAYIEAYINAQTKSTNEGVLGTAHSIPMLAFYGNWSDASMFDKGSYVEFAHGLENRLPYLYESTYSNGKYNGMLVKYADMDGEYWFGGNPMVTDATYMSERNAISAVRGDVISKLGFTAIRNAADSYYQVVNADTGEAYINESVGAVDSAYYYVNGGYWNNTYYTLNTGFSPVGIPEDTNLELGLTLVPEYYVNANGKADLNALGEGAAFSMPMIIDNTAATVDDVAIDTENNVLTVKATDNQYIAAVALYDIYGEYLYTYVGSDAEQAAGDTVEFALDLAEVNGPSFLVQVYDYAMNTATYEITTQIGEVVDTVESIELSDTELTMAAGATKKLSAIVYPVNASSRGVIWTSSDETVATVDETGVVTAVAAGNAVITATAIADETISASCAVAVVQLDATVYGVLQDAEGTRMMFNWDLSSGASWNAGNLIDPYIESVAYDAYRDTLFIQNPDKMYQLDPATGETIAESAGAAAFGAPCFDMAVSPLFGNDETSYLFGVYGGYVLGPVANLDNTFTSGWNLGPTLANKTGASKFVAICDYGYDYDAETGTYSDVYLALDNSGTLWTLYYDGTSSIGLGYIPTDLDLPYEMYGESQYCSLVSDINGDLYLSHFTGETNEIYYLTFNAESGMFNALYVDNVGADVWPAALYKAVPNTAGTGEIDNEQVMAAGIPVASDLEAEAIVVEEPETTGSLNSFAGSSTSTVSPLSHGEIECGENQTYVAVTAKDAAGNDVVSYNGVQTITYDPAVLTLVDVDVQSQYCSVNETEGTVTIGYVDLDGFGADETVAVLIFDIKSNEATEVIVTNDEVNDQKPGYVETLKVNADEPHNYVFDHFEVADDYSWAKAVYVCSDCADSVEYDAEIKYEVTVEPDCTEAGSAQYTITHGEESKVIPVDLPALGHDWEGLTCKRCGVVNMPFTDVEDDEYYYEPVIWAVENGITYGYGSEDIFAPDVVCNRGQVVTFLWRAAGQPEPTSTVNPFTDIKESDFFYKAVLWAVEEGITNGYGSSTIFNPNGSCTRGQVATFLWRFFGEPKPENTVNPFNDVDSDEFYYTAVLWAVEQGITNGYGSNDVFAPNKACNRGQIVTFLYRAMN